MVNKLKAVAYVRTATESMEDECKINAQLDAIKRYADVHGIEIVAVQCGDADAAGPDGVDGKLVLQAFNLLGCQA